MDFDDRIPIYYQLKQYFYQQIVTGRLTPGEQLPAVRQLAVALTVNVNTLQRALGELADEGIVSPRRGRGNFVTEDPAVVARLKAQMVQTQVAWLYDHLAKLGLTPEQMQAALADYLKRIDKEAPHEQPDR